MENVVILGSGCAGLTAAIYAARANLKPLVVSGKESGGQLMLTTKVENFPGFPDGVLGPDLIDNMKKQAEKFGTRFQSGNCEKVEVKKGKIILKLKTKDIETKTLIVATGASARWLGLESEKKYVGRGVSTCATCDAFFYKEKEVVVVGGGDSACEEAQVLSKFANKVHIIVRKDQMRASKIMQDRVKKNKKIKIIWNSVVEEVLGNDKVVTGVKIKDNKGKSTELKVDGMFLAIGHIPNTKFLEGLVELDEHGFVKSDRHMKTNVPGIFVSGDVQDPIYKQAVTAAGTGCQAALEAEKLIEST